jgi:hypothetical protein
MDLAIKFNDIGCAYYQEGCTEHAYDLFCGAMQALHHSATSHHCTLDEMDYLGRQVTLHFDSYNRFSSLTHICNSRLISTLTDVVSGSQHPAGF